jgi:hypothetical protein
MIYLVGILGFVAGFALGLRILAYLLRDRPAEDLLQDRGLRFTYGLLAWGIAGFTAFCAITVFRTYFPDW